MESAHWVSFVLQGVFQTPWPFGEKIEYSAPILRFILLVLDFQRFPGEDPKLLEKFLIVLLTFSEKGLRGYRLTC